MQDEILRYCRVYVCLAYCLQIYTCSFIDFIPMRDEEVVCPIFELSFVVHGAMGCGQKKKEKRSLSVAVPPAPVRVPSQRPLAPSVTSVTNDKDDNEMILGAVHRSPGICLTAEENPRKPQLGDRLTKGLCDQSSPPFLPNEEARHVRNGEGRK